MAGEFKTYRKKALVAARQMDTNFEVNSTTGVQHGKPGDYLVRNCGNDDMWPVPKEVFEATYEEAE